MNAPFPYFGGKTGLARVIVPLLPAHRTYIEPFFGSGAVLFAKPPSTHEIVNDLDRNIVTFFRVLRSQPDELARVCALSPHARSEYLACDLEGEEVDELERARRWWVRVNQSFAKTAGTRTGWSVTTARTQSVPGSIFGRIARFGELAERLARVTIECCDGVDLVARLATPDSVVYVDPPYLAETRSTASGTCRTTQDYRHDMGHEADHRRLAEILRATPATVVLSGYSSALYRELYAGWSLLEVPVTVCSSRRRRRGRGSRVESLWSNRPLWNRAAPLFAREASA